MKQIILEVEERKYKFFMDLIKNFDFINVQKEDLAKKKTLFHVAKGMQEAINAGTSKVKTRSAKSFLNEL